jgi:hypothetical protein
MTITNSNPKPKRRWFAIRLVAIFILVIATDLFLVWVSYSLNWIEQRHKARFYSQDEPGDPSLPRAPAGLWLFGENGHSSVLPYKAAELERFRRLFPEADVGKIQFAYKIPPYECLTPSYMPRSSEKWQRDFENLLGIIEARDPQH